MTEFTLTSEIIAALLGISGLNVGTIMVYIKHLHKETQTDIKQLKHESKAGRYEHKKLWKALCKRRR